MENGYAALARIANELGVRPGTLSQYVEARGSYTIRQSHSTPHRRKLPPRGSPEGILLAQRVKRETGTETVQTLVK